MVSMFLESSQLTIQRNDALFIIFSTPCFLILMVQSTMFSLEPITERSKGERPTRKPSTFGPIAVASEARPGSRMRAAHSTGPGIIVSGNRYDAHPLKKKIKKA
jgi:hypothetical protein